MASSKDKSLRQNLKNKSRFLVSSKRIFLRYLRTTFGDDFRAKSLPQFKDRLKSLALKDLCVAEYISQRAWGLKRICLGHVRSCMEGFSLRFTLTTCPLSSSIEVLEGSMRGISPPPNLDIKGLFFRLVVGSFFCLGLFDRPSCLLHDTFYKQQAYQG